MKLGGVLIKSNNALAAEREGRFPATAIGKALGVPAAAVLALAPDDGEWHHSSKFANVVRYFDLETCREYFASDTGKAALAAWREARAAVTVIVHENQTVNWLEWSGSRAYPKATEYAVDGCSVTVKGGTATVQTPDGKTFRKRLTTRGFMFRASATLALARGE